MNRPRRRSSSGLPASFAAAAAAAAAATATTNTTAASRSDRRWDSHNKNGLLGSSSSRLSVDVADLVAALDDEELSVRMPSPPSSGGAVPRQQQRRWSRGAGFLLPAAGGSQGDSASSVGVGSSHFYSSHASISSSAVAAGQHGGGGGGSSRQRRARQQQGNGSGSSWYDGASNALRAIGKSLADEKVQTHKTADDETTTVSDDDGVSEATKACWTAAGSSSVASVCHRSDLQSLELKDALADRKFTEGMEHYFSRTDDDEHTTPAIILNLITHVVQLRESMITDLAADALFGGASGDKTKRRHDRQLRHARLVLTDIAMCGAPAPAAAEGDGGGTTTIERNDDEDSNNRSWLPPPSGSLPAMMNKKGGSTITKQDKLLPLPDQIEIAVAFRNKTVGKTYCSGNNSNTAAGSSSGGGGGRQVPNNVAAAFHNSCISELMDSATYLDLMQGEQQDSSLPFPPAGLGRPTRDLRWATTNNAAGQIMATGPTKSGDDGEADNSVVGTATAGVNASGTEKRRMGRRGSIPRASRAA